jgi:hypothetical protein
MKSMRCEEITVDAICHWRMEPPFAFDLESNIERIDLLAACIGAQIREVLPAEKHDYDLVLCSSYLSQYLLCDSRNLAALMEGIHKACDLYPLTLVHSYECAGWSYALRFLADHARTRKAILVVIDIDIVNLGFFLDHPLIGKSGFGITSILLQLPAHGGEVVFVDGPYDGSGFKEFIRAIRSFRTEMSVERTFLPFFRDDLAEIAARILGRESLGPNLAPEFGHCFGSDAWIGIIRSMAGNPVTEPRRVIAATLAYHGYMGLCTAKITKETTAEFLAFKSDLGTLNQMIARKQTERGASALAYGRGA